MQLECMYMHVSVTVCICMYCMYLHVFSMYMQAFACIFKCAITNAQVEECNGFPHDGVSSKFTPDRAMLGTDGAGYDHTLSVRQIQVHTMMPAPGTQCPAVRAAEGR